MTLTTERQQFAEQNEMSMDFVNWFFDEKKDGCGNAWFIMAAAMWEGWKVRANREAQPVVVAWQHKGEPWRIILDRDIEEVRKTSGSWSPLYTAPPAPAVPEEMTGGIAMSKYKVKKSNYVQWVKGFNACRAAMLAQPVSSGYTFNSPVIPDGWVMVPKELTPEMMRAVHIRSELGGYATSNLSGAYNMFSEFWNVAVSAAPKVDDL